MAVKKPSLDELKRVAKTFGLDLAPDELQSYRGLMDGILASYGRIDELTAPSLDVKYARLPGRRPEPAENPLGAWYWRTEIKGKAGGPLAGKTVAVKDNVCVAGVPMMNGTSVLEGYVPEIDATVVTRILDAGGTIEGKAVCEGLCFSGGSHTSDSGAVTNPHDPLRSAGGSSSGSAALVAAGVVDMALGGDQGGSIRMPSSYCGIYGLKPTYGLVPYTGIFPIELTLDHTGPMAGTVSDVALLLEAIAGPDGLDPRQSAARAPQRYSDSLESDVAGLRIGIVEEGFAWPGASEQDVDDAVRAAAQRYTQLGATVETISIPWHRDGVHVWNGIAVEGATMLMVAGNSMGTNWKGHYTTSLLDAYARGRLTRPNDLPETVKVVMLSGRYMQDNYHGRYYAKAQNLARSLTAAYEAAFSTFDLLVMPTTPMKATPLPLAGATREESVGRSLEMLANACPFDVTGHPAMNVPVGLSENLPVGMMLVGRKGEESTILRAAYTYEQKVAGRPIPGRVPVYA